ncbi:hypothetical protein P8452_73079 [Trifolium repens]|nr:hypothetical protein P8452_73079 [Trifolium repens]
MKHEFNQPRCFLNFTGLELRVVGLLNCPLTLFAVSKREGTKPSDSETVKTKDAHLNTSISTDYDNKSLPNMS